MVIKQIVFDRIALLIKKEHDLLLYKIRSNKNEFRRLELEQTILKRELAELSDLYNYTIKRKKLEE